MVDIEDKRPPYGIIRQLSNFMSSLVLSIYTLSPLYLDRRTRVILQSTKFYQFYANHSSVNLDIKQRTKV